MVTSTGNMTDKIDQLLEEASSIKEAGNELFKEGKFGESRDKYIEGLKHVLSAAEELKKIVNENSNFNFNKIKNEIEKFKINLISNLSLTEIKLNLFKDALDHSQMVLSAEPGNTKAVYRRSIARVRLGENLHEAEGDLNRLLETDPSNREILNEIKICREKIKNSKKTKFEDSFHGRLRGPPEKSFCGGDGKEWITSMLQLFAQCGGIRPNSK
jgi:tetratricopeptide (TPR) repeat protein